MLASPLGLCSSSILFVKSELGDSRRNEFIIFKSNCIMQPNKKQRLTKKPRPRNRKSAGVTFFCPRCKKNITPPSNPNYQRLSKRRKIWKSNPQIQRTKQEMNRFIVIQNHYRHIHTEYEQKLRNLKDHSKENADSLHVEYTSKATELMKEDKLI